jgi:RHS repeat-associated protein
MVQQLPAKRYARRLHFLLVFVLLLQSLVFPYQPTLGQASAEGRDHQIYLPLINEQRAASSAIDAITPPWLIPDEPAQNPITAEVTVEPLVSASATNGPGLSIARNGANIQLTWTAVAGSQGYDVHRSTAPFFTPSTATLVQTVGAGTTTFTDNGTVGNPTVNYFYIVQAVIGNERRDSNTVGEIDYALNNAGNKYSLIALPFPSTTIVNAATLATYIGNVGALLKWNPSTQSFRFFRPPASGDNFPVTVGDAIFVLVNSGGPSVVTMTGSVTPIQYNLRANGFNFLSMPLQQTNLTAANLVAGDVPGAQALLAWNESAQLFRFFTPPVSGDNFGLRPGAPFLLQLGATTATAWPAALPPALNPPPLDSTVATNPYSATTFLYTGNNPVQTGMAPGTIEPQRTAVLRGRVLDRSGNPIPGVTITVLNHPEYGQTLSREDGLFDLVVNGGGVLTLNYKKTGYPPLQRTLAADWQQYERLPDVMLTPFDTRVTTVNLNATADFQVARGSVSNDSDSPRQATVLFPRGTQATITLPNGTTQTLSTLHVRFTEYTVGASGPAAMPGDLPPQSGYTYAVELTADQALANGVKVNGKDVVFNQPVFFYLDNFLDIPPGEGVPVGYYDNDRGVWTPTDDGLVIKIAAINNGLAELIVDSSGQSATPAQLAALGISDAERRQLASLYTVNKSLWRVAITHFSTYDCNFGVAPEAGAEPPQNDTPQGDPKADNPTCEDGSIIECQNQVLGETVDVIGTSLALHYRSDRTTGRAAANTAVIPVSGPTVPAVLKRIDLKISVAGQVFTQTFPALPNQSYTFVWNGLDSFGRTMQGRQIMVTEIDYVYDGFYARSPGIRGFGRASGFGIPGDIPARQEVVLTQSALTYVGSWDAKAQALGGWTMNVHHAYDPIGQVLYQGDGQRFSADNVSWVIDEVEHLDQLINLAVLDVLNAAVAPNGDLYLVTRTSFFPCMRIDRLTPDGVATRVAGRCPSGFSGDGGPAIDAEFSGIGAIAIDPYGNLYLTDPLNHRIRRIDATGIITTVAGSGPTGTIWGSYSGDGGPATAARLNRPGAVAIAPDGAIYVTDSFNPETLSGGRIRRVGPDGIITTVAGNGTECNQPPCPTDLPASQVALNWPVDIGLGPNGELYILDLGQRRVHKVGTDGMITTVAGDGTTCAYWDDLACLGYGGAATQAKLSNPNAMAIGADGTLYIGDSTGHIVRVGADGLMLPYVGNGTYCSLLPLGCGNGGPALKAGLGGHVTALTFGPDGALYLVSDHLRQVTPVLPGFVDSEIVIPSTDGALLYVFDASGRHLRTQHLLTGATLYTFAYDNAGRLIRITDGDGNQSVIERAGNGIPSAIVGPFGQRTRLTVNSEGYLSQISNPANETFQFSYTATGLLTSMTNPRNLTAQYGYDTEGRLLQADDAGPGQKNLGRVEDADGYGVTLTTAQNRTTTYRVDNLSNDNRRWTNTQPDGTQSQTFYGQDGSRITTQPDGVTVKLLDGPDPRFGMQASLVVSQVITTPGNLVANTWITRSVVLNNNADPLSLISLTESASQNGRTFTTNYTKANQTFVNTTAAGRQSSTRIDALGRIVRSQITGLAAMTYTYDTRGRLATVTQGSGPNARTMSYTYNAQGYVATITDPLGRVGSFLYDTAGRVTTQTLPDGRVITYAYDANGNLTGLTPPSKPQHTFTFTPVDLVASYAPPDVGAGTNATNYTYNTDRDLTRIARPDGKTVDFAYNTGGRLSALTISRGAITYAYHPTTGNVTGITAPGNINQAYTYDGSLVTSESWSGSVSGSLHYTYDNDFRVTRWQVNNTPPITLQYDADALLTQAGDMTFTYTPENGLLTGSTLGNVSDSWQYNSFGEPTNYSATYAGAALYTTRFTRDKLGRIAAKTETLAGVTTVYSYTYNLAGQISAVRQNGAQTAAYSYDSNGNRLTGPGGATGVYDNQDRLLQYGNATYSYTANGELLTKTENGQTTTYTYDELGNLTHVLLPNGTQIEYLIDGQNRRIGKKVNGVLVQGFLYGAGINPIAELDGNNNIVARFIYGSRMNVPDYMIKGGVTYRMVMDHLGSPRLVINTTTGAVSQRMDYDEFGIVTQDTSPGFQPFGFAGGLYDSSVKLIRFGKRDYDAPTGRWTVKDPIGFAGGDSNMYAYVMSDPVNRIDPLGLWAVGFTLNGAAESGGGLAGAIAVVLTSSGEAGIQLTYGLTGGVGLDASLTAGPQFSPNATTLADLEGGSISVGASAAVEGGIAGDVATSTSNGITNYSLRGGIGVGAGVNMGFNNTTTLARWQLPKFNLPTPNSSASPCKNSGGALPTDSLPPCPPGVLCARITN